MNFNRVIVGLKHIFFWFFLPLLIFLILVWLSVPWISRTPFVKRQIQTYLRENIKGEVDFTNLSLSRWGHLRVHGIHWIPPGEMNSIWLVDQAELESPFSSQPRIDASHAQAWAGNESIASASKVTITLQKGWKLSNIQLSLDDILLHTKSLNRLISSRVETTTSEIELPPHSKIDIENLRIQDSRLPMPLRIHGQIITGTETSHLDGIFRVMKINDSNGIASATVAYDIQSKKANIQADFEDFFIDLQTPSSIHFQLIGNASATYKPSQTQATMSAKIREVSFTPASLAQVSIPEVTTEFHGQWTNNIEPDSATLAVSHAPLLLATAEQSFPVPSGKVDISVSRSPSSFQGQWRLNSLGDVVFHSSAWPLKATTPIQIQVDARQRSLEKIAEVVPNGWKEQMKGYKGLLNFKGTSQWLDGELRKADFHFSLQDASTVFNPFQIQNAKLQGHWTGDVENGQISVDTSGDISWVREDAPDTELNIESMELALHYKDGGKRFSLQSKRFQSALFREIKIERTLEGQWNLTTSFSTSENMNRLWHTLFPKSDRDLFGMGEIAIEAQWQNEQGTFHAACPDLTIHSMMQEPSFGVQFQDWNLDGTVILHGHRFYTEAEVNSVSPYLSYDGQDYQWVNKPFEADFEITPNDDDPIKILAKPPGGGNLFINWFPPGKADMEFVSLDFDTFAFPVFLRFILKREKSHEVFGIRGTGKVDGWLTIKEENSSPKVTGAITHHHADFIRDGTPAFKIQNATLTVPFSNPLRFESLPMDFIDFKTEEIHFNKKTYKSVACTLPISASKIVIPTPFQVNVFGGDAFFHQFQILDWTTNNPDIKSQIDLEKIELPRLSRVIPLFPARGSLNGKISEIAFSKDRFFVNGRLNMNVFGGDVVVKDIFLRQQAGGSQIIGASMELNSLDLEKLTSYYNLGLMTGSASGFMHDVQILLPPPGSDKMMKPVNFEVEIKTDTNKEKIMSYDALMVFGKMGVNDLMIEGFAKRDKYYYSGLGVKATLKDNRMRIKGLMRNDYVVAPSNVRINILGKKFYFSDTIGIRFPESGKPVDFNSFWNNIVNMTLGDGKPTTKIQAFPDFNPF